jgi:hypothetical protein
MRGPVDKIINYSEHDTTNGTLASQHPKLDFLKNNFA